MGVGTLLSTRMGGRRRRWLVTASPSTTALTLAAGGTMLASVGRVRCVQVCTPLAAHARAAPVPSPTDPFAHCTVHVPSACSQEEDHLRIPGHPPHRSRVASGTALPMRPMCRCVISSARRGLLAAGQAVQFGGGCRQAQPDERGGRGVASAVPRKRSA